MNRASTHKRAALTPRGQATRRELLDAAEVVFGKKGFERTAISDITRRAQVALGTFYVYFPHKEAIFVELVDELGERLRRTLSEATAGAASRLDKERAGFRAFFEFAAVHRNLYRIVRQAEFVDEAAYHRYYGRLAQAYGRGLERAMDAREIGRFDAEVLAYALMGIADFIGMRFVTWDSPQAIDRVTDEVLALIRHGVLSDERLRLQRRPKAAGGAPATARATAASKQGRPRRPGRSS